MKLDEKDQDHTGGTAKYSYENSTQELLAEPKVDESFNAPAVASRARNRTVMLSPDVTGQVRNLLQSSAPIGKSKSEDPFQKPSEVSAPLIKEGQQKDTHATGTFSNHGSLRGTGTSTYQVRAPLMEGLIRDDSVASSSSNSKSDKVEGTLELTHEHFRRATGERKLEELGIGLPVRNQNFLAQTLKEPTLTTMSHLGIDATSKEQFPKEEAIANASPAKGLYVQASKEVNSRVIGFLVSYDNTENGEVTELRVGRWLVSSKSNGQKDVLVFEDESISAIHAVIKVSDDGVVQIMDQLSDQGSGVLKIQTGKELDASESAVKVLHGDLVRFGSRYFVYCAIPKIQIEN